MLADRASIIGKPRGQSAARSSLASRRELEHALERRLDAHLARAALGLKPAYPFLYFRSGVQRLLLWKRRSGIIFDAELQRFRHLFAGDQGRQEQAGVDARGHPGSSDVLAIAVISLGNEL